AVLASLPKKTRRMSLSMPTISKPSAAKKRTASAPIRPADPETTITLIYRPRSPLRENRLKRRPFLIKPFHDLVQDHAHRPLWGPTGRLCHACRVGDVERDVRSPRRRIAAQFEAPTGAGRTEFGQSRE